MPPPSRPVVKPGSPSTTNAEQFDRARKVLVGGVNSAVRAFRAVGGTPRFIARGEGAYVWDVEGRRYIDYLGSWGPLLLGHSEPRVVKAVQEAALRGLSFGAPNMLETDLAEKICELYPHVDRVRFTSSGTEATMSAIGSRAAIPGGTKLIKFEGCYHGTADSLLVKAGSGALAFGTPTSAGVPEDLARHTLVATFNDLDSVAALFEQYPDEIAGLIVEPVAGNMNLVLPRDGFLQGLRDLCDRHHAVLIFDEVMTGFRVGLGGAQAWSGVTPDLSTFGKVIGGGMPVGAVGGVGLLMDQFAPLGPVYQAGTLSGNPIAMAAGLMTLEIISRPGYYERVEATTRRLADGLNAAGQEAGVPFCARSCGTMAGLYFRATPPDNLAESQAQDIERFKLFYHAMLDGGVYLPPSPVEAFFVSSAHSAADIDRTLEVARQALQSSAAA